MGTRLMRSLLSAYIPVITHQSRVALEVGKIVAKGQGMGIPYVSLGYLPLTLFYIKAVS